MPSLTHHFCHSVQPLTPLLSTMFITTTTWHVASLHLLHPSHVHHIVSSPYFPQFVLAYLSSELHKYTCTSPFKDQQTFASAPFSSSSSCMLQSPNTGSLSFLLTSRLFPPNQANVPLCMVSPLSQHLYNTSLMGTTIIIPSRSLTF